MFKSILVPYDGSQHSQAALQQALWIALKEEGSIIHGLHVVDIGKVQSLWVPGTMTGYGLWSGVDYFGEIQHELEEAGARLLDELAARCADSGVRCDTELVTGTVDRIVVERAQDVDVVVMGHRGTRAPWAGFLLGSVFESVVRHSRKPVMACLEQPRPLNRVLTAYDGSRPAIGALETAAGISRDWGLPLVVLVVPEPPRVAKDKLAEARHRLDALGISADLLLREGQPAEQIQRVATEESCDLIVLGATGHSRLREILFGSTVDRVVHNSHVPVLVCH